MFLFYPGVSEANPRLSSFRPSGAEYVCVFTKSCTKPNTLVFWQGFPRKPVRPRDGPPGRLYKFAGLREIPNLAAARLLGDQVPVIYWRCVTRSRWNRERSHSRELAAQGLAQASGAFPKP